MTETLNPAMSSGPIRDDKGRLLPGHGMGRPKNSRNVFSAETIRQIKDMTPDALAGLQSNIAAGNMEAIKFVLERVIGKGRMIELEGDKPTDISNALLAGDLTTEEALSVANVIEKLARVQELDIVLNRMADIERLLKG